MAKYLTMAKDFDKELFKDHSDYWQISDNIKNIYMSEGSLLTLLDFERVLDQLDVYAFKNWDIGELVQGPTISKYKVSCIFMWPEYLMPDPRGGTRLLPFDCEVKFKRTNMKIPMKIEDPSDYIPGTKKARIVEKKIWLVEISMPKSLMSDIRTGSIDLEDQEVDLSDLDAAYDDSHTESSAAPGANALTDPATNAAPAPEQKLGM
jgi:hypothetical protein